MVNTENYPTKEYVEVSVIYRADGSIVPRFVKWKDGQNYKIEYVRCSCPAKHHEVDGEGYVFYAKVGSFEKRLYLEKTPDFPFGRWFIYFSGMF